ncbi:metallophosphoesterase [Caldanaerobius polysaccharolyticus]|uniref:metallophosphoesterase n=1 Tax=Caldanaerobius polysaccharolyticus TaxID=44256 RepID=UPI00047AA235|nr:metallophosphoesterase [Caldanaerobius polysaccharolyticus]
MADIWFISDLHFGHGDIIKYEDRPFKDVLEMDEALVDNWNSVVSKEDEVFVLGDFSFYDEEKTAEIVHKLNGYKFLIMGNHDLSRGRDWFLEVGFNEVSRYPIIYHNFYILSHEPLYINRNMPYINVHGHIHSQKYESNQYFNVCVERTNYKPVNFISILKAYNLVS